MQNSVSKMCWPSRKIKACLAPPFETAHVHHLHKDCNIETQDCKGCMEHPTRGNRAASLRSNLLPAAPHPCLAAASRRAGHEQMALVHLALATVPKQASEFVKWQIFLACWRVVHAVHDSTCGCWNSRRGERELARPFWLVLELHAGHRHACGCCNSIRGGRELAKSPWLVRLDAVYEIVASSRGGMELAIIAESMITRRPI